jgi:hypothetical protein
MKKARGWESLSSYPLLNSDLEVNISDLEFNNPDLEFNNMDLDPTI